MNDLGPSMEYWTGHRLQDLGMDDWRQLSTDGSRRRLGNGWRR